jgi:TctA family transporter
MDSFLEKHSGEVTILLLAVLVLGTLLFALPQLLRMHMAAQEMLHAERMRALESGQGLPQEDNATVLAGRTAFLVPMVSVCVAGTVSCFLITCKSESVFAVALTVWTVAGVISLAAITGGVALMGRLAQLHSGAPEEEPPANPLEG